MDRKIFTEEEISILSQNKYVKKVSVDGIIYDYEFKKLLIIENQKGKVPRQIFEKCGFNINILGKNRINAAARRWRNAFRKNGFSQLQDTRKFNTGRPNKIELSIEEKYKKLEAKIKLLEAENELLKKLDMLERGMRINK